MKPIPILTLNWNGLEDTLECLQSLMDQSFRDFHVYLLDNGSEGDDFRVLKKKWGAHPQVSLIHSRVNLGFTKGNNFLLKEIFIQEDLPEYLILLNNDTSVNPDWLENLINAARKHNADVVSCKMINYYQRNSMDNAGHFMLNTAEIIPIGHGEPVERYSKVFENFGSCAGATLYSTAMLKEIGFFDEYFNTGYEDAELGARAIVLGYKCIFEPSAVVYHKISRSVNKIMNYQYLRKIQLNIFYTYFKLMPYGVLLINLPSFFFKYGSIIIIDILFLRWKFLKLMLEAIYISAVKDRKTILEARKAFFRQNRPISSIQIIKKQTFFLWFDIKRFFKYVVFRRKTQFEKY